MEFEKRFCMFFTTGVWLFWKFIFFYASIGYRMPLREEYIHYALNAVIFTLVFFVLEKHTEAYIGKSALTIFIAMVFVAQIILENYMLEYLRFMPYSNWDWSLEKAALSGLTIYTKYGYPGYHWAFLVMIAICFFIIVLRANKSKIMIAIKDFLFNRAEKTKNNIYFTLLFQFFYNYITVGEYLCLKDWYLFSEIDYSLLGRCWSEGGLAEMDKLILQPLVEYFETQEISRKTHQQSLIEPVPVDDNGTSDENNSEEGIN